MKQTVVWFLCGFVISFALVAAGFWLNGNEFVRGAPIGNAFILAVFGGSWLGVILAVLHYVFKDQD